MVIPSSGPKSPAGKLAVSIGVLVLAAGAAVMALQETRLTCSRTTCETVKSFPGARTVKDLRDVRAVEIHQGTGKQSSSYYVDVLDSKGSSSRLHTSDKAGAHALKRELEALLAGQRAQIEVITPPMYWMFAFVALLVAFGVLEIRDAIRSWGKYAPAKHVAMRARDTSARRRILIFGGAAIAMLVFIVAGTALIERSVAATTGLLQLECPHRCEFSGGSCQPGGTMEARLDVGDQPIRVWNPDVPGSWESHTVRIELGQTTRFVCAPGR